MIGTLLGRTVAGFTNVNQKLYSLVTNVKSVVRKRGLNGCYGNAASSAQAQAEMESFVFIPYVIVMD